jgi:hypothetical protein
MRKTIFGLVGVLFLFFAVNFARAEKNLVLVNQVTDNMVDYDLQEKVSEGNKGYDVISNTNPGLVNSLLDIPGVNHVTLWQYRVTVIRGKAFDGKKVNDDVCEVLKIYYGKNIEFKTSQEMVKKFHVKMNEEDVKMFQDIFETLNKPFFPKGELIRVWEAQGVTLLEVKYPNGKSGIWNADYWKLSAN